MEKAIFDYDRLSQQDKCQGSGVAYHVGFQGLGVSGFSSISHVLALLDRVPMTTEAANLEA